MTPSTDLQDAIRAFLREQESLERSRYTLLNYTRILYRFAGRVDVNLGELRSEDIADYLIEYKQTGVKGSTVALQYRFLRAFFNWCELKEIVARSPMYRMRAPRQEIPVVAPYSDDEVKRMLNAETDWSGYHGQLLNTTLTPAQIELRNRALITLLHRTGIRRSEAAGIRRADIRDDVILIRGKGRRERFVPLDAHTNDLLTRWLEHHRQDSVFELTAHSIYNVIYRAGKRAGVPNAFTHRFRDTFAIRYLERGGSIDNLQTLLGHANINMTLRYVQHGRQERALAEARRLAAS